MDKGKMANHLKIGKLGEDIACRFLEERGFKILERNYWKKWGEIDIVAHETKSSFNPQKSMTHFVEVKTLASKIEEGDVNRETKNSYKPEDAVHPWKIKRMSRVIQSYLLEKSLEDAEWQFDIIAIFIDPDTKIAKIRFFEKLII